MNGIKKYVVYALAFVGTIAVLSGVLMYTTGKGIATHIMDISGK